MIHCIQFSLNKCMFLLSYCRLSLRKTTRLMYKTLMPQSPAHAAAQMLHVFMCTDTSPVWVLIHLYTWRAAFRMWTWLLWFVCCPVFVHCPAFWMLTLLLHWFQSSFNKSTPLSTVNHLSHVPHLCSLYFLLLAQQFPCQIPASLMPSQFYS